ncbi:MAG TPA: ribonuclease J [Candidatus Saccharimonadales bacterium]|nr:ribonuclease J [Candidatus Saccharimonadales bacterium]
MAAPAGGHPTQTHPLQLIPLGGLGEFGMNMMALRHGDAILVVDTGLMFPDETHHGVDFIVPDMTRLFELPGSLGGVILSHGHDDHIGALPYLFQKTRAPVYGSRLTLGLARKRLDEHQIALDDGMLNVVAPGQVVTCGPFTIEFIHVTHSIPDALAVAIRTPAGLVVHTADFKMDQTPVDELRFDLQRFAQLGDEGVLALLSDSTNASRPGFTPSERTVGLALEPLMRAARGRVVVTTFASNIHRIQQVVDVAVGMGRKVALTGRSMMGNVEIAREMGYLHVPEGCLIEGRDVSKYPAPEIVILASGSQGEPMSSMARIALDRHSDVSIERGDLVILSARRIPGNEVGISRMVNHLCRRGADVLLDDTPGIHVSGHASREELKLMIALTRPRYFVPIHGDFQHLSQHARLAREMGLPEERVLLAETGDMIEITPESASITGKMPVGSVFIDGRFDEVDEMVIRDRQHIAADGVIMPIVVINKHTGEVESPPEMLTRGFVWTQDEEGLFREAGLVVMESITDSSLEERADNGFIRTRIVADLKRFMRKRTRKRPLIIPVVMEV